jgi:integrase
MKTKHDEVLRITFQKLKYLNYSDRTIETYIHYCKKFLESVDKYHQHLVASDFQSYLNGYNFTSISQQNQIINAIKFLYKKVLGRSYGKVNFQRPRKEKKLPRPIDKDFLVSCINQIENLKHKAILSLAFSVGLRVSEVINLTISDIDSKRMMIFIRESKGRKDRYVPLSEGLLNLLRLYFKEFKPKVYLFNGQNKNQYTSSSCNKLVKRYVGRKYHFHQLRHSSFTAMMENGTDTRIIQKLAGHSSIKTTQVYTHVSNFSLQNIALPI